MGSLATTNADLSGHKVVILQQWDPPKGYVERLKRTYPGLDVLYVQIKDIYDTGFPRIAFENATILCTYSLFPTPAETPNLQFVQLSSAGINHLAKNPLYADSKIKFCTSNGIHPPQIAEWVIATFLSFQHHLPRYQTLQESGTWVSSSTLDVEDSVGLRMGILGYGAIGRQCACLASALGMDVLAFTQRERLTPESRRDQSYRVPGPRGDPEGLIPSAWFHGNTTEAVNHFLAQDLDIVVIALPLTSLTRHMIGKPQFEIMSNRKTFVSNIGRGEQIVTDDLIEALEQGWIRGAALDVTDPEPLPQGHKLWKAPNLTITPHVSGHSKEYGTRVLKILEENLERLSKGEQLVNEVDRELGY